MKFFTDPFDFLHCIHRTSDMLYAEVRLVRVCPDQNDCHLCMRLQGPQRVKRLYAFRSLIDSGARITLGSDFPVEDMNPLAGFFSAITRVSRSGTSPHGPGGWFVSFTIRYHHKGIECMECRFPDQCLTREEALRGTHALNSPCNF